MLTNFEVSDLNPAMYIIEYFKKICVFLLKNGRNLDVPVNMNIYLYNISRSLIWLYVITLWYNAVELQLLPLIFIT